MAFCDLTDLDTDFCVHCKTINDPAGMKRRKVEDFAYQLMADHGLIDKGWSFGWDTPKTRVGQCSYTKRLITLSAPWVDVLPEDAITNTILHEIAHALAGGRAGHGPVWRSVARSIGCTGDRCIDTSEYSIGEAAWIGTCPACARTTSQHRAPLRVKSCSGCSRVFNPKFIFEWRKDGELVSMPKRYREERALIERRSRAAIYS